MAQPVKFEIRTDTTDSAAKLREMVELADKLGIKFAGVADKVKTAGNAKKKMGDQAKNAAADVKGLVESITGIGL